MVKEQIKNVVYGKKDKIREESTKAEAFVVTFHPKLTRLAKKMKKLSKYLHKVCVYSYSYGIISCAKKSDINL